ncbi:DUF3365 domain-containing protein [Haloferula sp. BvORR071]|uniref:c-type heme family protein n=1 Tax=Haloferula sp. BvORR071 TaxID=1396141 RepID=UPI000555A266|nr:DUF3365 domain-containing protein [Haloferula sp. BvORR071]
MSLRFKKVFVLLLGALGLSMLSRAEVPQVGETSKTEPAKPAVNPEARVRAQLLHEMIHGALQVMHRDYFDPNAKDPIPSSALEDVFVEMKRGWDVDIRWLAVNGKAMNIDHEARNAFEKAAVKSLAAGGEMHDAVADGRYLYAGAINLGNSCLKCHVPDRQSLENRKAAVVISMPLVIDVRKDK